MSARGRGVGAAALLGLAAGLTAGLTVGLAGCSTGDRTAGGAPASSASTGASSPAHSSAPRSAAPSRRSTSAPSATGSPRRPPDAVSLPALFDRDPRGGDLRLGAVRLRTDAYTEYDVTYRSGDLRISGVLAVPAGRGRHPALVLAHGYIDPAVYVSGQGMTRERDWLARAGYVVLHVDYRNHAGSDDDPAAERRLRLGYTVDVVAAVQALRETTAIRVDDRRIGLVGRSMGGGVVQNVLVTRPGLVRAGVVFASVSSSAADNWRRWIRDDPGRSTLNDQIVADHGTPAQNPRFWRQVSPRTYLGRITEPVLILQGTADSTCPPAWATTTQRAMRAAGVDSTLVRYAGEEHAFGPRFADAMTRTVRFLDARLGRARTQNEAQNEARNEARDGA